MCCVLCVGVLTRVRCAHGRACARHECGGVSRGWCVVGVDARWRGLVDQLAGLGECPPWPPDWGGEGSKACARGWFMGGLWVVYGWFMGGAYDPLIS